MGGGGGKLLLGKVPRSIAARSGELLHLQQSGIPVRAAAGRFQGGRSGFCSCELEFAAADHTLKKSLNLSVLPAQDKVTAGGFSFKNKLCHEGSVINHRSQPFGGVVIQKSF